MPVRMDWPSSSQLMLFSFSRIEDPSPVMLLKMFGRLVKTPLTMLISPSATLPRKSPSELTRLSRCGPTSIPLISAVPRFFALSFRVAKLCFMVFDIFLYPSPTTSAVVPISSRSLLKVSRSEAIIMAALPPSMDENRSTMLTPVLSAYFCMTPITSPRL